MTKVTLLSISILFMVNHGVLAQKFVTDSSHVSFFSEAAIEDIKAHNKAAKSVFDASTGEIVFSVPIGEFEFEKSLMKEHFNENYLETEKYPKSTFKGKLIGFEPTTGVQEVTASGTLEIHGISREVSIPGKIDYSEGNVRADAVFMVKLKDYKIKIPRLLFQNIAEEIEVTVTFYYSPYEKN